MVAVRRSHQNQWIPHRGRWLPRGYFSGRPEKEPRHSDAARCLLRMELVTKFLQSQFRSCNFFISLCLKNQNTPRTISQHLWQNRGVAYMYIHASIHTHTLIPLHTNNSRDLSSIWLLFESDFRVSSMDNAISKDWMVFTRSPACLLNRSVAWKIIPPNIMIHWTGWFEMDLLWLTLFEPINDPI